MHKESSDELNPAGVITAVVDPAPGTKRSAKDYLALATATCGVGYLPLAPGTWGSLLAVVFYLFLHWSWYRHTDIELVPAGPFLLVQVLIIAFVTMIGTWAASRSESVLQIKDPGKVVIDEVAGQLIALVAVPATFIGPPFLVIAAFILFRFFDIVKPYPARKFESLPGGYGIMADDLVAGLYAGLTVGLIRWIV